ERAPHASSVPGSGRRGLRRCGHRRGRMAAAARTGCGAGAGRERRTAYRRAGRLLPHRVRHRSRSVLPVPYRLPAPRGRGGTSPGAELEVHLTRRVRHTAGRVRRHRRRGVLRIGRRAAEPGPGESGEPRTAGPEDSFRTAFGIDPGASFPSPTASPPPEGEEEHRQGPSSKSTSPGGFAIPPAGFGGTGGEGYF